MAESIINPEFELYWIRLLACLHPVDVVEENSIEEVYEEVNKLQGFKDVCQLCYERRLMID